MLPNSIITEIQLKLNKTLYDNGNISEEMYNKAKDTLLSQLTKSTNIAMISNNEMQ
jgi:hypothetical protein